MYFIPKTYCNPQTKISNVVERNPAILLALENLDIKSFSKETTFQQISIDANINVNLLTLICNLHNGFFSQSDTTIEEIDIPVIIGYNYQQNIFLLFSLLSTCCSGLLSPSFKAFHSSSSVHHFFLSCVERMRSTRNAHVC